MTRQPNREEQLFTDALAQPDSQRAAFLDRVCGADRKLRAQIEALLAAHAATEDLAGPAALKRSIIESEEKPGDMIGRYKLLQKIGEGGCGIVYMAEQEEPVRRRVALKVIKLGMDTKAVIARFEAERQALAMMDHPNIAKVLDAGATGIGRPFFVMELVRGIPITTYCDENNLTTAARLELFIKVCHAIQHAHQKGVIHRDIKPSNILVTLHDGEPVPKVIDFGIAKATLGRLTDATLFTAFEQFLGTPAYMSPEQAELSGLDIDTRSDIYSLGVLLYELLTGRPPFDPKTLVKSGLDEIRRMIREVDPLKPSTQLSTLDVADRAAIARLRGTDAARLPFLLSGDLDCIVMKALEKNRTRRYDTPSALVADIAHHLASEPVTARPPSAMYRLEKAVRRNKLAFGAAAAVSLALVAGTGLAVWQAVRAHRAQQDAEASAATAAASAERERQAQQEQTRLRKEAEVSAAAAAASELNARRLGYASDMVLAFKAQKANDLKTARRLLDRYRPSGESQISNLKSQIQTDLRGWEWRYLWQFCGNDAATVFSQREGRIANSVSLSSDGALLAVAFARGGIEVWDLPGRRLLRVLQEEASLEAPQLPHLAFSPQSRLLAATAARGVIKLHDLATSTESVLCSLPSPIQDLSFSADGEYLTIRSFGDATPAALVLAVNDGRILHEAAAPGPRPKFFNNARLSPDRQRLYVSQDGSLGPLLRCINLSNMQSLWERDGRASGFTAMDNNGFTAMDLSPDGSMLVTGTGFDYSDIRVWNARTGDLIEKLVGHTGWICQLTFSKDGRKLASASNDQTIRLWDTATWKPLSVLRGHTGVVRSVAFASHGESIASAGGDGAVMLWDIRDKKATQASEQLPARIEFATTLPGGSAVLARSTNNAWSVIKFSTLQETPLSFDPGEVVSFSPPSYLGAYDGKSRLRFYDVSASGLRELGEANLGTSLRSVFAYLPEKRLLAWDDNSGNMFYGRIDELPKRTLLGPIPVVAPNFARFTTNGRFLIVQGNAVGVVFDVPAGVEAARVRFRPVGSGIDRPQLMGRQGDVLASLTLDGFLELRKLSEPGSAPVRFPHVPRGNLAFSPDRTLLAVSGGGTGVTLYDTQKLEKLGAMDTFTFGLAFSPDGRRLVTVNGGREGEGMRVWDVASRQELLLLSAIGSPLFAAEFTDDGNTIFAGGNTPGLFQFWRAPSWSEIEEAERKSGGWPKSSN